MDLATAYSLINATNVTAKISFPCHEPVKAYFRDLKAQYGLNESQTARLLVTLGIEHAPAELFPILDQLTRPPDAA